MRETTLEEATQTKTVVSRVRPDGQDAPGPGGISADPGPGGISSDPGGGGSFAPRSRASALEAK